jgi:hypothetical protein
MSSKDYNIHLDHNALTITKIDNNNTITFESKCYSINNIEYNIGYIYDLLMDNKYTESDNKLYIHIQNDLIIIDFNEKKINRFERKYVNHLLLTELNNKLFKLECKNNCLYNNLINWKEPDFAKIVGFPFIKYEGFDINTLKYYAYTRCLIEDIRILTSNYYTINDNIIIKLITKYDPWSLLKRGYDIVTYCKDEHYNNGIKYTPKPKLASYDDMYCEKIYAYDKCEFNYIELKPYSELLKINKETIEYFNNEYKTDIDELYEIYQKMNKLVIQ